MTTQKTGLGRPFNLILAASVASSIGDGVREVAIPLLAADLTDSAFLVSLVGFAGWLPWLTVSLVSGVLVDRWDRRRVMVVVDGGRAITVGILAVVAAANSETWLVVLVLFAFVLGVGETFFDPAAQALLPAVVPRAGLVQANSRLQSVETAAREFIGPPLGGVLFAVAAVVPFVVDSASFALSALLVAAIPISARVGPDPEEEEEERLIPAIRAGLDYLWNDRPVRLMALILGVWMFVDGAVYAVLVLFALRELDMSEAGFGLLFVATAIGSIAGSLATPRLAPRARMNVLLATVLVGFGVTYVLMGTFRTPAVALAGFAVTGVASGVWNVVTVSFRQARIPEHLFGRVSTAYRTLGWGGTAVGSLVGGVLATVFGLAAPLLFAGVVIVGLGAVALVEFRGTTFVIEPDERDDEDGPAPEPVVADEEV